MPPAMHIVTTPHLALRRRPSSSRWPTRRAPVMPNGWPIEMAPPLTLSRSPGMPSLRWQYSACEAKASFISHRSMSCTVRPWRASSLGTANTGPMPISSGSHPATAKPRKAPRGDRPRRSAWAASISTQALEPSDSCEALPAVMNWPGPLTGSSLARPSSVVPGRLQLSRVATTSRKVTSPVSLFFSAMRVAQGTISSANRPWSCAAAVRFWLSSENRSWSSRLMP